MIQIVCWFGKYGDLLNLRFSDYAADCTIFCVNYHLLLNLKSKLNNFRAQYYFKQLLNSCRFGLIRLIYSLFVFAGRRSLCRAELSTRGISISSFSYCYMYLIAELCICSNLIYKQNGIWSSVSFLCLNFVRYVCSLGGRGKNLETRLLGAPFSYCSFVGSVRKTGPV